METSNNTQWVQGQTRGAMSLVRAATVALELSTWFGNVTKILECFMLSTL